MHSLTITMIASSLHLAASFATMAPSSPGLLTNADFADGTFVIDKPGVYKLAEDIVFNPNSVQALRKKVPGATAYEAGGVLPHQFRKYDPAAFGIGFFAAIAVATSDVVIDLNQHSIEQSIEHALQMRFFALIQLNSAPFVEGSGPHNFVGDGGLKVPMNVTIRNGRLGRSAHHGILGNDNIGVRIQNVQFKNFEIAAIHLNGARDVLIEDCNILGNRNDVPVLGTFSAGRFLRRYMDHLVRDESPITLTVAGHELTASEIQTRLKTALNNVWTDLVDRGLPSIDQVAHPDEYALFHNARGIPDGNVYGIVINQHDVAVFGFPTETPGEANSANNITIRRTKVADLKVAVNEVISLCNNPVLCDQAQKDPVGATWQVWEHHPDDPNLPLTVSSSDPSRAVYTGNDIANAQAFVAKAILKGEFVRFPTISIARNSIGPASIEFVESSTMTVQDLLAQVGGFICNTDTMFHLNKGVIGIRIDGARTVHLEGVQISNVKNSGEKGSEICTFMHWKDHIPGGEYGGAYTRGVSLASASDIHMTDVEIEKLTSSAGSSLAVDVQTESKDVFLTEVVIQDLASGVSVGSEELEEYEATPLPMSVGVRVDPQVVNLVMDEVRIGQLSSPHAVRETLVSEAVPYPVSVAADKPEVLQGVAVTGWNKRKGLAAFDLPILGKFVLGAAGASSATEFSEPIGNATSCDAYMTCYAEWDIATVKFRDEVLWWEKANGNGAEGLTVRQWLQASGTLEFDCEAEGGPLLRVKATGAVPGGLYSLWGFFYDQNLPHPRGLQPDFPFGGTSNNVYVADAFGNVDATRGVALCLPKLKKEERRQLVNLFFVFHPEGRVDGGVGNFVNAPPLFGPGCSSTPQIMWSAGGAQLVAPTGCPE